MWDHGGRVRVGREAHEAAQISRSGRHSGRGMEEIGESQKLSIPLPEQSLEHGVCA